MDVHDPRRGLFGRCEPRISNQAFDALVADVMTAEPYASAQRVFWVVDNGTVHRGEKAVTPAKTFTQSWTASITAAGSCRPPERTCVSRY
jgi:hypothetical protein